MRAPSGKFFGALVAEKTDKSRIGEQNTSIGTDLINAGQNVVEQILVSPLARFEVGGGTLVECLHSVSAAPSITSMVRKSIMVEERR